MSRDVDPALVRFPDDARDVWADILRVSYPRLRLPRAPTSPWRVYEVVETRARILDSGELELYADTHTGEPVTLRIGVREWSWR